jgi:hypothetical protein
MVRKSILWMGFAAAIAVATMPAFAGEMAVEQIEAKAAFEKLKALKGDWNGTAKEGFPTPVSYGVRSNGSVVMETLFPGTDHEMITVYHLVGNDLLATHYCAAGNQPHFKLDLAKSTLTELVFTFDGGTSFDPAKDGHVHDGRIVFADDGKLNSSWTFYAGGVQKGAHDFHLTRVETK